MIMMLAVLYPPGLLNCLGDIGPRREHGKESNCRVPSRINVCGASHLMLGFGFGMSRSKFMVEIRDYYLAMPII